MMELGKEPSRIRLKSAFLKKILDYKLDALIIYLIVFIVAEIMISGGLYEKGIVFGVTNSFFVLALALLWQSRRKVGNLMTQICRGITMAVVYAVLDFLLVELLLERFNHAIYKSWSTYVAYGIILLVPILYQLIPQYLKGLRENKVSKNDLALDKP